MKRWILGLLLGSLLSCHKENNMVPSDTDLLCNTWRQTQALQEDGSPAANGQYSLLIEFRQDGQLLYGVNKSEATCCLPNTFKRDGDSLNFTVKYTDQCAFLDCTPYLGGGKWQIISLTDDKLVLGIKGLRLLFIPAT